MLEEYAQLGALAVIVIFTIQKVFDYLKAKKINSTSINYERELAAINLQLNNHYNSFQSDLNEVKSDVKSIKDDIIDIKICIKK
jgi:hypothetical protein